MRKGTGVKFVYVYQKMYLLAVKESVWITVKVDMTKY